MTSPHQSGNARPTQGRPSVAAWPRVFSLGTRLALAVTLSVAIVIGSLAIVGLRLLERRLDADLRETARVTAAAVADDIELRPDPLSGAAIAPALHDFMAAAPSLQAITVFRVAPGELSVLASTSSAPPARDDLVRRALESGTPVWRETTPHAAAIAAPVRRGGRQAAVVVVTVSLAPIDQLRRAGGLIALGGTIVAIAGITLLLHLLANRLVLANELRERTLQLARSYDSVLQLREAAARTQQLAAVGQTVANVAHQIGTPLNLVSGHVQLLRHESDDPALQRRLRIIAEQVERVESTVRDLLDRARPHAERKPVDAGAMLNRLAAALRPRLAAAGVTLDVRIGASLPTVAADEARLELAVLNLVTNALDSMPGGGTLSIRASSTDTAVHVEIADTGAGIPAELLPRIFEPWMTTKAPGSGTGLGLTITREVVQSLGGTIAARSTPGAGSTFIIDLPAFVAEGAHA
jgi:signal transduction histidine kinase